MSSESAFASGRSRPILVGLLPLCVSVLALTGCPPAAPPPSSAERVGLQLVAAGLTAPVDLAALPDGSGRHLIADQVGLIHVADATGRRDTPLLDLRSRLVALNALYDERGLLGLALHPDFSANGRLFVFYNAPLSAAFAAGDSEIRVSEFLVSADLSPVDPAGERVLLRIAKPQSNHNGGALAFGPDGCLYIGVGDGGGANDVGPGHTPGLGNGQDRSTLLGKILRINVDGASPYDIPPDNPFVEQADTRPEIFALGFRNPWRFSFDRENGAFWVADVGQSLTEEVNRVVAGGNYGWNIREGSGCFDPANATRRPAVCPDTAADGAPLIAPVLEYDHRDARGRRFGTSVIGGFVYRGAALPAFRGQYLFGDYSAGLGSTGGRLFAARPVGTGWEFRELAIAGFEGGRLGRQLLAFGEDAAGELYLLTTRNSGPTGSTGEIFRIVPAD